MKAAACLPPAAVEELEALEASHHGSEDAQRVEQSMLAVTKLGRWPLARTGSQHQDERRLAWRVRSKMAPGRLSKADEALLEEMRWMHRRGCEAERLSQQRRLVRKREQARVVALARARRIRSLLAKLQASMQHCTCHDFDCWVPLWKMIAALAMELRGLGCHFYDCALAPHSAEGRRRLWRFDARPRLQLAGAAVEATTAFARAHDRAEEGEEEELETDEAEVCSDVEFSESSGDERDDPNYYPHRRIMVNHPRARRENNARCPMSDVMRTRLRRRRGQAICAIDASGGLAQPSACADCSDSAAGALGPGLKGDSVGGEGRGL